MTLFGEILPVISRAVDDDDDEPEVNKPVPKDVALHWCPAVREEMEAKGRLHCTMLLISIGPAANAFTLTYFLNQSHERVGVITSGGVAGNSLEQTRPSDRTCYIHRLTERPGVMVLQCNISVSPEAAFSFADKLLTSLTHDQLYVGILTSALSAEYRSELGHGDLEVPLLRALRTSQYLGKPMAPYLEQPNTCAGLGAQLLTYCQLHRIAAVLYCSYTDSLSVDQAAVTSFSPVLQSTPMRDMITPNEGAAEQLRRLVALYALQDNDLYI